MEANDREAALDQMVSESQEWIDKAKEVSARLGAVLESFGITNPEAIDKFLQSDLCPPELSKEARENIEQLWQELEAEENSLAASGALGRQGRGASRPRRSTRGIIRV